MRKRSDLLALALSLALIGGVAACSDSTEPAAADSGPKVKDQSEQPKTEGGTIIPDKCECDEDQVCNTDFECVDKPEPADDDVLGKAIISQLENEYLVEYDGVVGRYDAVFWESSDKPSWADPRTSFTTKEGILCYHDDSDCSYPGCNNFQVWLPKGLGAGDLSFQVEGAPAPVVLEAWEASGDWQYKLKEGEPGPLQTGTGTAGSWFDARYVPLARAMTMEMAGGDDFDADTFEHLAMPARLAITSPTPGVEPPDDEDLKITWDGAQGGTTINIELISGNSPQGGNKQISCSFRDTGSVTIPKAEVAQWHQGHIYMSIQRDATRYVKTKTKDGRDAHLMLTGRFEVQHYFYER